MRPLALLLLLTTGCSATRPVARTDLDGWPSLPVRPATYERSETRTVLVPMRDGVKLAVDVHLPQGLAPGTRLPTIVRFTRYGRRIVYNFPFNGFLGDRRYGSTRGLFVQRGYAWVDVDARGTGASDGVWPAPWSQAEVADEAELVTWITTQDWSNGRVGATGISYDGTAAELLLVHRHPAVKAIAPRYAPFDVYADMAFPGGLQHAWLTRTWSRLNDALDHNELARFFGVAAVASSGIAPVDGELRPTAAMKEARARNLDVHRHASAVTFRDDAPLVPGAGIEDTSPHARLDELRAAAVPMYVETGWADAACSRSSIHRFLNVAPEGSRLVIGPWEHGGKQNVSPWAAARLAQFDHDGELLRFFDRHLLGLDDGESTRPKVTWFTVGADTWRGGEAWPPRTEPLELFFDEGHALRPAAPADGADEFVLDPKAGTGTSARWNSLINLLDEPLPPADQAARDARRLTFTSAPLEAPLELTGHPELSLVLSADARDTAVFAWLEDVDEQGRAWVITEGSLRALHRRRHEAGPYRTIGPWRSYRKADAEPLVPGTPARLDVELLPASWRVQAGHRLRVSLAGADVDHFAPVPASATRWTVRRGARGSRLVLPVTAAPPAPR